MPQDDPEPDEVIDLLLKDIVYMSCHKQRTGKVNTVLRYLLVRLADTRLSIQILNRASDGHTNHRLDSAALLRVMYDAYIQAKYIVVDPAQKAERASLYIEYEHVERYLTESKIEKHDNILSKALKNSPNREAAKKRNKQQYDRVEHLFRSTSGRVRNQWYAAQFSQLAEAVGLEHEYDTFIKNYHGCMHSSVYAIKNGPHSDEKLVYIISNTLAARMLLLCIKENRFPIQKEVVKLLKIMSKGIINLTEKDRPK